MDRYAPISLLAIREFIHMLPEQESAFFTEAFGGKTFKKKKKESKASASTTQDTKNVAGKVTKHKV
jgi:chromosome segregation ATPase